MMDKYIEMFKNLDKSDKLKIVSKLYNNFKKSYKQLYRVLLEYSRKYGIESPIPYPEDDEIIEESYYLIGGYTISVTRDDIIKINREFLKIGDLVEEGSGHILNPGIVDCLNSPENNTEDLFKYPPIYNNIGINYFGDENETIWYWNKSYLDNDVHKITSQRAVYLCSLSKEKLRELKDKGTYTTKDLYEEIERQKKEEGL